MKVKQVIVMRTDTDPPMRKGKMIAQGSHSSCAFLVARVTNTDKVLVYSPEMMEWFVSGHTKICVRVDSEADLLDIYEKAKAANLEVHLIEDTGKTEFKEPTKTCLAIGPNLAEEIDKITSHLKLL